MTQLHLGSSLALVVVIGVVGQLFPLSSKATGDEKWVQTLSASRFLSIGNERRESLRTVNTHTQSHSSG